MTDKLHKVKFIVVRFLCFTCHWCLIPFEIKSRKCFYVLEEYLKVQKKRMIFLNLFSCKVRHNLTFFDVEEPFKEQKD